MGTAKAAPHPQAIGSFGPYRIHRQIGEGGFATVYEGLHSGLKKRVAIKFLNRDLAAHEELRRRFLREGEAASRIRHPHVVDVTDVGTHDGIPYLVMEYLEGEDLGSLIARERMLDERTTAELMLPVISAVYAAHTSGVLHRDLKPENIFLTQNPDGEYHPVVLDFGISEITEGEPAHTAPNQLRLGTPCYMSPERVLTGRAGAKGDQFAVGVILYEMVTGVCPFERDTLEETFSVIKRGDFQRPKLLKHDLDPAFETLILRAMADDENERFESLQGLGLALLPFARRRQRVLWEASFGIRRDGDSIAPPRTPSEMRPSERPTSNSGIIGASKMSDSELREALRSGSHSIGDTDPAIAAMPTTTSSQPVAEPPERSKSPVLLVLLVILLLGAGGGAALLLTRREPPPEPIAVAAEAETFHVVVRVTPSDAVVELDGRPVEAPLELELPKDGQPHTLLVHASGYEPQRISFVDHPPPGAVRLVELERPAQPVAVAPTPEPAPPPPPVARGASRRDATMRSVAVESPMAQEAAPPPVVPEPRVETTPTPRMAPIVNNAPIIE